VVPTATALPLIDETEFFKDSQLFPVLYSGRRHSLSNIVCPIFWKTNRTMHS